MRIWKWELLITDTNILSMPDGAKVLTVQMQGSTPKLWAMVDEKAPIVNRKFETYGTGNPMPDSFLGAYVGTYQMYNGSPVFHVFDRGKE